jgi:16S rRNA (uracil1498-N3)-methyltransferase
VDVLEKLKNLYFEGELTAGAVIDTPRNLARRLNRVLRMKKGQKIGLFNGKSPLFEVEIAQGDCSVLNVSAQIKPFIAPPQVTLITALVKKEAMDKIFRQATEMGVTHIQPVTTDFTVVDKLNTERVEAMLVEAVEQCERLEVPQLLPIMPLKQVVESAAGHIFWCAEHVGGKWGEKNPTAGDSLLIGPEGGFSEKERLWLKEQKNVQPVGLGTHILRADTAVVAACSRFYDHIA